ncbi:MAG: anaerobic sulfatase maturase [Planctomycetota bacterium]|jgi:uncharacterized protein
MQRPPWSQLGLHVIAKPIGPICNIRCAYCFYLEKESLYPGERQWKMSDETLEAYVRQYLEAQPDEIEEVDFAFQGGEPTLMGLDFFHRVIELQAKHAPAGKRVHNSLQTNGILLDDRWCEFLREHNFLVGLSVDGPADLHDRYRRDRKGEGTFDRVVNAMERLQKHGVEFNALTCVSRRNGDHPLRVYGFLRDRGVQFIQFIPIVQPLAGVRAGGASPGARPGDVVSDDSVGPKQFGRFLIGVFDEWVSRDVGRVFVRDFDQALAAWVGAGATLCVYAEECGRATALEHNGDLYSCDHFVDPNHKLGNIHHTSIARMANLPGQEQFGKDKSARLPNFCRRCDVRFACHGACPKDRFLQTPEGEPGLNFLCEGYKAFFTHVGPYMQAMADEVRAGRPAAGVMQRVRARRERARREAAASRDVGRNAPCPCGSGRKYKQCCMRR